MKLNDTKRLNFVLESRYPEEVHIFAVGVGRIKARRQLDRIIKALTPAKSRR